MTPRRSLAYGRVVRALKSPSALDRISIEAEPWIEQLADHLEDAGPAPMRLVSMGAQAHAQLAAWQAERRVWR